MERREAALCEAGEAYSGRKSAVNYTFLILERLLRGRFDPLVASDFMLRVLSPAVLCKPIESVAEGPYGGSKLLGESMSDSALYRAVNENWSISRVLIPIVEALSELWPAWTPGQLLFYKFFLACAD